MADLYLFNLPDSIPPFSLPLRSNDQEPTVDLQAMLNDVTIAQATTTSLTTEVDPLPLSEADLDWIDALLRERDCARQSRGSQTRTPRVPDYSSAI